MAGCGAQPAPSRSAELRKVFRKGERCAPSMANVIQLFDSFRQGGTEWQTVQLTRLLHESGKHRLFLASLNDEGPLRAEVEKLGFQDIPSFPLQNFYNLNAAKQLAKDDPKLVANVVKAWVGGNE